MYLDYAYPHDLPPTPRFTGGGEGSSRLLIIKGWMRIEFYAQNLSSASLAGRRIFIGVFNNSSKPLPTGELANVPMTSREPCGCLRNRDFAGQFAAKSKRRACIMRERPYLQEKLGYGRSLRGLCPRAPKIYRFGASPDGALGGGQRKGDAAASPGSVEATESALGSLLSVALSSAQSKPDSTAEGKRLHCAVGSERKKLNPGGKWSR